MKRIFPALYFLLLLGCDSANDTSKTIASALQSDPCANVICDHGDCINGQCDCEEGYSGPSCAKEITPSKIVITAIELKQFPPTKSNGGGWDLASGPDLMFQLVKQENNSVIYKSKGQFTDATNGEPLHFLGNGTIEISDANGEYVFRLLDADEGIFLDHADDVVSGIRFNIYNKGDGFPTKRIIETDDTKYTIQLKYYW